MIFTPNKTYEEIFRTDAYEIDLTGGRGRGGSHFVTDYFLFLIMTSKYFRGYFMRQVHGDIRESLYRDFKDRIEEKEEAENIELFKYFQFNDTSMSVTYIPNGNQIHSKGFRKSSSSRTAKMKSIAGATHIIIEEFEEVEEADYMQLDDSLRTTKVENIQILRVWNPPPKDHWILNRYYTLIPSEEYPEYFKYIPNGKHPDHLHIFSTYLDNIENINHKKIRRWEAYKDNERTLDHYITDIVGLVSSGAKGQIFKKWKLFKELPDDSYFYRVFGVDWGGNDPNTLMELNFDKKQRKVYIYEHLYQPEILNSEFIQLVKEKNPDNHETVCDTARRDKRFEFSDAGINVIPADKTKINDDFRKDVIDMLKEYDIYIYEKSENLIIEAQMFKWALDPTTKEPLNKPEDKNNHCWDAIFYATRYYHTNFSYQYNKVN
jgi:phage terminase large subunit